MDVIRSYNGPSLNRIGTVTMVSEPPPSHLCRSLPNSSKAPPTAPKLFPINHPPWSSIATPILPTELQEETHFQPWPDLPSDHCNLIFANPKEYFSPNPSYYPPQPQPQYYQTQHIYSPNIRQPPGAPPPYARRNPQEKQGVNYPPSVRSDVSLIASSSITHPHRSKEWVDQYLKSLQEKARKQSPPPYYMEYCQEKARRYPTPLQHREYLQEKMEMQPTMEVSMSATLPIVDVVEEEENDGELAIGNNEEDQESEASKQDAEASSSQYFNNHEGHFFPKPMPVVEVSLGEMQSTVSVVLEENVEALVEQHRCINIGSLYAQVKELHPWADAKFVKEVIDASCFTFILVHSSLARLTIALWGPEEHYSKYTSENGSEMVGIVTDASLAPEMHTLEATPVCKALYFLGVMGNSTCSLLDKLCEDGIVRQWVELIEDGAIVVIFDPGGGEDEATLADTGLLKNILMNKNDTGKITIVRLLGGYLPDAIEDTVLSTNSGQQTSMELPKKLRRHPPSASHVLLPDGRSVAYQKKGVSSERARFSVVVPHSFLSSRLAGLPGTKASLLEEFGVRLVTYDLPGFGESDPHPGRNLNSSAVDMLQLADAVGIIDKFWVVGYTGGGKHAWSAVRYIPEGLAGVAMFAPMGNPYDSSMTKEERYKTWELYVLYWHHARSNLLPGGTEGLFSQKSIDITEDLVSNFRNQGGYGMLGRTKDQIRTTEQVNAALAACQKLNLDGFVIIGGVTSNTDAAQLAETFYGDLKNQFVEANVGFDTICKVNSQLVSNICTDALSAEKYYYFIRLMGRRASHVTLECALQSHPKMVILSEEVTSSKLTLFDITKRICDAVQARAEQDKYHGVLLSPEGLIESIPEVYALLQEIHVLLMNGVTAELKNKTFPEESFLNIDVPADVAHHKGIKITKQGRFIIRTGWKQTDNSGSLSEESYQTANMTGVSVADTEDGAFATPSEVS